MLIEGAILVKQLVDLWNRPDWQFPPCPAGSELGLGERYVVFACWPDWGPFAKKNPPAPEVIRDELEAIGVDSARIQSQDRGQCYVVEVKRAGVNVKDVQAVFSKYGGIAVVCYTAGAVDAVPEISWDALEAYQEAVDDLHAFDAAWWTKTVATWTLVAVLAVGVVLVVIVLVRKGRK